MSSLPTFRRGARRALLALAARRLPASRALPVAAAVLFAANLPDLDYLAVVGGRAALERFQREARAASSLNHPGIVAAFGQIRTQAQETERVVRASMGNLFAGIPAGSRRAQQSVYRDSQQITRDQERAAQASVRAFVRAEEQKRDVDLGRLFA